MLVRTMAETSDMVWCLWRSRWKLENIWQMNWIWQDKSCKLKRKNMKKCTPTAASSQKKTKKNSNHLKPTETNKQNSETTCDLDISKHRATELETVWKPLAPDHIPGQLGRWWPHRRDSQSFFFSDKNMMKQIALQNLWRFMMIYVCF